MNGGESVVGAQGCTAQQGVAVSAVAKPQPDPAAAEPSPPVLLPITTTMGEVPRPAAVVPGAGASTTAVNVAPAPAISGRPALVNEYTKGNNLIVNYVPKSFADVELYELFGRFGEIESARAIQDRHTGQCAGYGFIKFRSGDAAAHAVQHYEAVVPDHRQLKVHFARPSSTHKQCNIYISGLPIHYTEDNTKDLFAPYGPVVEVKLLLGPDGSSRGCAFVRLCAIVNTQAAISALHESVPPGGSSRLNVLVAAGTKRETANNPCFSIGRAPAWLPPYGYHHHHHHPAPGAYQPVRHQAPVAPGPYGPPKEHFTGFCLFVFNLPGEYDETALRAMFGSFGQVTSARVMRDPATGRSKSYGFVNMGAESQAQMAIQALNGYPLNGKALKVQFKTAGPTAKPPPPPTASGQTAPAIRSPTSYCVAPPYHIPPPGSSPPSF